MFLTDFGDAAVTLPLATIATIVLLLAAGARVAAAWVAAVGGVFATMLALKLVFGFCPPVAAVIGLVSPSGHTAGATVVYAGLARLAGARRLLVSALAVLIATAVAISRLLIGAHTPPEVMVGAAVGLGGVLLLLRLLPREALPPPGARAALLVSALLVVVVLHGQHAPFERMLLHWRGCRVQLASR